MFALEDLRSTINASEKERRMFIAEQVEILLCSKPIDMRKGIIGLEGIVRDVLRDEPFSGKLFVFYGRRRDSVKVFYWHRNGFAMWTKKLQQGRFPFAKQPTSPDEGIVITRAALRLMLDGAPLEVLAQSKEKKEKSA